MKKLKMKLAAFAAIGLFSVSVYAFTCNCAQSYTTSDGKVCTLKSHGDVINVDTGQVVGHSAIYNCTRGGGGGEPSPEEPLS